MSILSVQSHVAYGHVGNSAAVLALQCLGHEVWPVNTVQFSNHPGHGQFAGRASEPEHVREILDGLAALGVFKKCRALLTGYLASAETGVAVLDAWARIRRENPDALFICDPVLGDRDEGLYVSDRLLAFYRDAALPLADAVLPNAFELEALTGRTVSSIDDAVDAAEQIIAVGPRYVIVSSAPTANPANVGNLLVSANGAWTIETPKYELKAKGAGDLLSALWIGHLLNSGDPGDPIDALERAVSASSAIIEAASGDGLTELPLVALQQKIRAGDRLIHAKCLI